MKARAKDRPRSRTRRRSVTLPRQLVEEASALAPPHLRQNLHRLVTVALQEFAARQKAREFEDAIADMARDPAIRAVCSLISEETTERDARWRKAAKMVAAESRKVSRELRRHSRLGRVD